jgi:hypothetical protein
MEVNNNTQERYKVTDATITKSYQKLIDNSMHFRKPLSYLSLLERELSGGACPLCAKPMDKVEVDNPDGAFSYYKTTCSCLPPCPGVHMLGFTREKRTDQGVLLRKSQPIRIDRECGEDFSESIITDGSDICPTCQKIVDNYSPKEEQPKVKRSAFKG